MKRIPILLLPALLAGCAWLAPTYHRPQMPMPDKWGTQQARTVPDGGAWWRSYNDPVLDALVDEALKNNDDLALAGSKLQQARAQYKYAFANQLPSISVAGADAMGRLHLKDELPVAHKMSNLGFVGGMLNYEADFWGKNASLSKAAKAGVKAAGYGHEAARLSIAAATTKLYFSLRALDRQREILQRTIETQTALLALVQRQHEVGAVDALVVQNVTEQRDAAQAALPDVEDQRGKAESALAVMLGRSPEQIIGQAMERGKNIDELTIPIPTPPEIPSTLLERRPDIAMHEQTLIASNFNIGFARAAYFPTISLASLAGVNNIDIDNLYRATTRSWTLAASMAAPVMDFGRTASGVKLARAEKNEQVILYKQSIRTAFREVHDALLEQDNAHAREQGDGDKETAAEKTVELTQLRLEHGYASRLDVLSAQVLAQQAEQAHTTALLSSLDASVDMYRAIGGGFDTKAPQDQQRK
ncbi:efflux transporter outer membrane subunit [Komagataeibacter oboediens]|uniref:efflux transporter outer membrane subunit n=1 Tax=Komagataeibacter oboediens TaxID=65958 RepID=UPI001C2CE824|nr:efflux transporter outer membrane subunit [Komagataeibacter oboediens]MBV1824599.1 efflux transporter outer membrane subunit [Komagataeibacter oboediens]